MFMTTFLVFNKYNTIRITPTPIFGIMTFCDHEITKKVMHSSDLLIYTNRIIIRVYDYMTSI